MSMQHLNNISRSKPAGRQKTDHNGSVTESSYSPDIIRRFESAPGSLTSANIMQLQSILGNKAVYQLMKNAGSNQGEALQGNTGFPAAVPGARAASSVEMKSNSSSSNIIQKAPVDNTGEGLLETNTELETQVGPSCWLFVLDAVFKEFNEQTLITGVSKYFYPSSDNLDSLKKQPANQGKEKRIVALEEVVNRINQLIAKVNHVREANLTKAVFEKLALRVTKDAPLGNISEGILGKGVASLPKNTIIANLQAARVPINTIKTAIENKPGEKNDEEALLNNTRFDLGGDSAYAATVLNYKTWFKFGGGKLPMYMYINSRFLARKGDDMNLAEVDWTGRGNDEIERRTPHAVLLVGIDYGDDSWKDVPEYQLWDSEKAAAYDDGFIVYKDPNYGNARIKIKWSHLAAMIANDQGGAYFGLTSHQ